MSTDDSDSPVSEVANEEPSQKQGSTLRWILIALLVVAIIALGFDLRARSAAKRLHDTIKDMLPGAPVPQQAPKPMPTMDTLHEEIARAPSVTYDHEQIPNTKVEEYRYRGGLPWKSYVVYVYYRANPEPRLYSVSLNQPEEF